VAPAGGAAGGAAGGGAGDRAGGAPATPAVVEPLTGRWLPAARAGVVLVVAAGIVLRLWARSPLWLDEALTVDIARLPVHEIPSYLKRDGAPPLYYVLLHYWMGLAGTSDLAVRSLSALFSVATLPVAWVAGRRLGGRAAAWTVVVFLASAPFAIYYGTEARMYSLVMLLTACGFVAVARALDRPRPGNLAALALVVAALLYTQYWAVYLTGALGLWLLWTAWRGREAWRSAARWMVVAVAGGVVLFLPWVPTFLYQARYTGTPWAAPPNFAAVINAITGFTDNQATLSTAGSNQGRLLAVCYFALGALAVFGVARDRWHVELDLRTRFPARIVAFVVLATLLAAITGGIVTGSAFSTRYASVVFVPLLLVVAAGTLTLADARLRLAVVAVVAAAGLAAGVENVWTERTQAAPVAAVLDAHARPGDVVAYCPDQLGPAVYRLMAAGQDDPSGSTGRYRMLTYPRGTGPAFVDWVNYKQVAERSNPAAFARRLERMAGTGHDVWLVTAPGYIGFGAKCQRLVADLEQAMGARQWVQTSAARYYEPMSLLQFAPEPRPSIVPPAGPAAGS
jgi:mannosyltransferase